MTCCSFVLEGQRQDHIEIERPTDELVSDTLSVCLPCLFYIGRIFSILSRHAIPARTGNEDRFVRNGRSIIEHEMLQEGQKASTIGFLYDHLPYLYRMYAPCPPGDVFRDKLRLIGSIPIQSHLWQRTSKVIIL